MRCIDLNCDMGEGMPNDAALMALVSSANIACGYHAGDEYTMEQTIQRALVYGVAIGAHPSFPDREHFGRKNQSYSVAEISAIISSQLGMLSVIADRNGARMSHVKPHGALYNMAAADESVASAIADAVYRFDPSLLLYALAGSELVRAGQRAGLKTVNEVFADRNYQNDGSLTPRSEPGALITDPQKAAARVIRMIEQGAVESISGEDISIVAETVCIHGDEIFALEHAQEIRHALRFRGISIIAPQSSE